MRKNIILLTLLLLALTACGRSKVSVRAHTNNTPLVVAYSDFSSKFSLFTGTSANDRAVASMTQLNTMVIDRSGSIIWNGIEGETRRFNGLDYFYQGPADLSEAYDPAADITVYRMQIRSDLCFSDGIPATIDDVIFAMYIELDPSYVGQGTLFSYDIVGLQAYRNRSASHISGIRKIDDYTVEVSVNGYSAPAVYAVLSQTIVPRHYYGDLGLWDYENHQFGFPFGDVSVINRVETKPMGAGPYTFVKFENRNVYFEANPLYYKGEPKIKHMQYKEAPAAEIATGIASGSHDMGELVGNNPNREYIEKLGDIITTQIVDNGGYGYMGINAYNVCIGGQRGSEASKNLRKGLATVLAVFRDIANNSYYGEMASTIQYPMSSTSWAAWQPTDDGYEIAYAKDIHGNHLYTSGMNQSERTAAALEAALGFFEAAGFTVENGKVIAGPEDSRHTRRGEMSFLEYTFHIPAGGVGDHPAFTLLTDAANALASIGITLDIRDINDGQAIWAALDAETADLWAAAWGTSGDPDMYQSYHGGNIFGIPGSNGSNRFGINDPRLDELIMAGRIHDERAYRKAVYKQAMDMVMDWAVEIPNYQRKNFEIYSTERIDTSTLTPAVTTYWGGLSDIHLVEMR